MSTTLARPSALALVPGPTWSSFEKFRKGGNTTLEEIPSMALVRSSARVSLTVFCATADFQHLVGLATDVRRLQQGLNVIIQAAKVVAKHPDQEHVELLIHSPPCLPGLPFCRRATGMTRFN